MAQHRWLTTRACAGWVCTHGQGGRDGANRRGRGGRGARPRVMTLTLVAEADHLFVELAGHIGHVRVLLGRGGVQVLEQRVVRRGAWWGYHDGPQ